jgi:P-type Cu+ transporter
MAKSKIDLKVDGMTCQSCVRSIEKRLSRVAGVESARVDLTSGKATVEYDDERADVPRVIGAIEEIGFHASQQT